jgi:hypothetical protein
MEDLSPRKPPHLNIRAEDTSPAGENGALVWSTQEGRLLTYNEDAERWGIPSMLPALCSLKIPGIVLMSFVDITYTTTIFLGANNQFFVPFYLPNKESFDNLGYEVTTAASSGYARVGIYNTQKSGNIMLPNQLIIGTDNMNIISTGIKTATITSTTLYAGVLYWASILVTANVTLRACFPSTRWITGATIIPLVAIRIANSTGNLVNPAPSTTNSYFSNSPAPIIIYQ